MAFRYSYDPVSSKLSTWITDDETPAPNVTPDKSKVIPKSSPKGGSSPATTPLAVKPRNYYLAGEKVPEGVETELEQREIDGKIRLVKVPVVPELDPEVAARISKDVGKESLATNYDPKTNEFQVGLTKTPDEVQPKQKSLINNPIDAFQNGVEMGDLYSEQIRLAKKLNDFEAKKNVKGVEETRKELDANQELLAKAGSKRGDPNEFAMDYFWKPLVNVVRSPIAAFTDDAMGGISDFNKLATGTTLLLTESLLPMLNEGKEEIAGGAAGGFFVPGLGTLGGAAIGALAGNASYYTYLNVANQYLNQVQDKNALFGENISTVPTKDLAKTTDFQRALVAGLGETAVDAALGYALKPLGALAVKGKSYVPLKATNFIPKGAFQSPLAKRFTGILGSGAMGAATEGSQSFLEQWGQNQDTSFYDIISDETKRDQILQDALVGGVIGVNLAATGAALGTAFDAAKAARNKARLLRTPRGSTTPIDTSSLETPSVDGVEVSPTEGTITKETPSFESNLDGKGNKDTSSLEEPVIEDTPTNVPSGKDLTETVSKVENVPDEEIKSREETTPKPSFNEITTKKIEQFEATQAEPKTPSELKQRGEELGLPIGEVWSKIVNDPEAKVDDNTPRVKTANNVIKGIVEAAETAKFYNETIPNDPEVLDAFAAYHGSPHEFEEFDIRQIGSGEGATAYGHGLYFAENKDVAKWYQSKLGSAWRNRQNILPEYYKPGATIESSWGKDRVVNFNPGDANGLNWSVTVQEINDKGDPVGRVRTHSTFPTTKYVEKALGKKLGNLYEVSIKRNKGDFIDWDSSIKDNELLLKVATDNKVEVSPRDTVKDVYLNLSKELGSRAKASAALEKEGIAGIKYLDAMSREDGDGSFNYVVFSDKDVKVSKRNDTALNPTPPPDLGSVRLAEQEVLKSIPPNEPMVQVARVTQGKNYDSTVDDPSDPLSIPAFLKRTKPKEPLASSSSGDLYDSAYVSTGLTYTPFDLESMSPETRAKVEPLINGYTAMGNLIANQLLGSNIASKVDLKVADLIESNKLNLYTGKESSSPVAGVYLNKDMKLNTSGKTQVGLSLGTLVDTNLDPYSLARDKIEAHNEFVRVALHEFTHSIDIDNLLTKSQQQTLTQSIKAIKKKMEKDPDWGFITSFDPNDPSHRSEILAYYSGDFLYSDHPSAVAFRKQFGVIPQLDLKQFQSNLKGDPFLNRILGKILDAFRALLDYTKQKLGLGQFSSTAQADKIFAEILGGDIGRAMDASYLSAANTQLERLRTATQQSDIMASMGKLYSDPKTSKPDPIKSAYDANKRIATERPNDIFDIEDVFRDKNNLNGFNTKLGASVQWLKNFSNWARTDGDAAWAFRLTTSYQEASAKLHGAWAGAATWIRELPDVQKKFQMILDLRKQGVSLNTDKQVVYTNRLGQRRGVPASVVEDLKNMSRVFSLPLDFMTNVMRGKLDSLKTRPGFQALPSQGTKAELDTWVKEVEQVLKEAPILTPIDRIWLNRAKDLINNIGEYEKYKESGVPYVPELRKGQWALTVTGKDGELVGLYTIDSPGKEPSLKARQDLYNQVVQKYKGRSDLTIAKPDQVYQMTYNRLGDKVRSAVDVNLITSLISQRAMGLIKASGVPAGTYNNFSEQALRDDVMAYYQTRGFGKRLINSKHIDGMSEDVDWVLNTFFNSSAKNASNAFYGDLLHLTKAAYDKEAAREGTPTGRKFANLYRKLEYAMDPAADAPFIRSMSYLWGLAYRPSTAVVQLAPLISTVPANFVSMGIPMRAAVGSLTDSMKYIGQVVKRHISLAGGNLIGTQRDGLTMDEVYFDKDTLKVMAPFFGKDKALMDYAIDSAMKDTFVLNATLPDEAKVQVKDKFSEAQLKTLRGRSSVLLQEVVQGGAYMMSLTERAARTGTYFATIKNLYDNKSGVSKALMALSKDASFKEFRAFNPQLDDIRAIACFTVQDGFGFPHKAARNDYNKGYMGALFAPFTGIPSQLYGTMIGLVKGNRGRAGQVGALVALMNMAVIGGIRAAVPTIALALTLGLELWEKDKPGELTLKAILIDQLGGKEFADLLGISEKTMADILVSGLFTQVGTDISSRIALSPPFLHQLEATYSAIRGGDVPSATTFLGVPGQLIETGVKGAGQYMGDRLSLDEVLLSLSPAVVKDVGSGIRMAVNQETGVRKTGKGKELIRFKDYSNYDILLKTLGFQPLVERDASVRNRVDALARSAKSSVKASYKQRLIELGAMEQLSSDPEDKAEYRREYRELWEEMMNAIVEMDPEDREAYFSPEHLKRLKGDIRKGINRRINPDTEEGLTNRQKQSRDETSRFLTGVPR